MGKALLQKGKQLVILHPHITSNDEQEMGLGYKTSQPTPNKTLPPSVLHLQNFPQPQQTVPPVGDQVFKHMCLKETVHILIMAVYKECIGMLGLVLRVTHEVLFSFNMNEALS